MTTVNLYEQDNGLKILDHRYYPEGIKTYMRLEEEFFLKHLQGGTSLLEIGCGDGRYLQMLAPIIGEILGVDYSENLVKVSQSKTAHLNNVNVIHGNAKDLETLVTKTYQYAILAWNTIGNMPKVIHSNVFQALSQCVDEKIFISTYQCNDEAMQERLQLYKNLDFKVNSISGNQVIMEDGAHCAESHPISYFQSLMDAHGFSMETYMLGFCGIIFSGARK